MISKRCSKCDSNSKDPSEQDIRKAQRSLHIQEVEGNGKLNELYPLKKRLCWRDTQIQKGVRFFGGAAVVRNEREWKTGKTEKRRKKKWKKVVDFLTILFLAVSPLVLSNYGSSFSRK